jgi:hypothetical protein
MLKLSLYIIGLGTGLSGFDSWQRHKFFFTSHRPDRLWGLPSLLFNGYRGSFLGDKAAGA